MWLAGTQPANHPALKDLLQVSPACKLILASGSMPCSLLCICCTCKQPSLTLTLVWLTCVQQRGATPDVATHIIYDSEDEYPISAPINNEELLNKHADEAALCRSRMQKRSSTCRLRWHLHGRMCQLTVTCFSNHPSSLHQSSREHCG